MRQGLNQVVPNTPVDPAAGMQGHRFDPELILPLSLIRTHTKTDDIIAVTDDQLNLYRKAALQTAEKYTGFIMTRQERVTFVLPQPRKSVHVRHHSNTQRVTLPYAPAQSIGWVYGGAYVPQQVMLTVGSRVANVPIVTDDFGLGCCNPCHTPKTGILHYIAGYTCEDDLPAALALGALKYIAHVIENPGDIVVATNEGGGSSSGQIGIGQSGDPAIASGALAIWRTMVDSAI